MHVSSMPQLVAPHHSLLVPVSVLWLLGLLAVTAGLLDVAATSRRAARVASLRVTTATGNVVPLVFRDTERGR
jgi:hypothetical protein